MAENGIQEQLTKYLTDAHSIEEQALAQLEVAPRMAGGPEPASDPELASLFDEHLVETRDRQELVDARLDALGGSPSKLKDLAMKAGAINSGSFFAAHPDTPGKLVAVAYAFEHLEIAGYEQLRRVAEVAGDGETADVAARILEQERVAAGKLAASFDRSEASLRAQGITV
jgi:ferritin-like metal-binding protein YciE